MPEITHQSLELPGYWRLATFGKLTRVPRRGMPIQIRAYLLQIGRKSLYDIPEPEQRSWTPVAIPIGEIPRLHPNAVILDGKMLRHQPALPINSRKEVFYLDFARENLRVFSRYGTDDAGKLIIPDTTGRLRGDPEGVSLYVAIGFGGDPYAYVVSCTEILRFFYATSSTITAALFSGDFLDPWNYLWDLSSSFIHPRTRAAFIQLRQRTFDHDARFLARFAFDPYALDQAVNIYKHATGQSADEHGDRLVRALPPVNSTSKLTATLVPIGSLGRKRSLITRIHACDWGAPYSSLEFLRDNDGRFDSKDRDKKPQSKRGGKPVEPPPDPPPEELTLSTKASSPDTRRWAIQEQDIADRFPELSRIPAEKLPRKAAKTKGSSKKPIIIDTTGDQGSVERPRTSAELIGQVLIHGIEDTYSPPPETADDVDAGPADAPHLVTLALLKIMAEKSLAAVEMLRATEQYTLMNGVALCVFPYEVSGSKRAWLYLDKDKTIRRMAVVASIERKGRTRYLIDIQQRGKHECSMVVCWSDTESVLPVEILRRAINACADAKGPSLWAIDHLGVKWNRLKHYSQSIDEAEAKSLLGRIFRASMIKVRSEMDVGTEHNDGAQPDEMDGAEE